ncbi:MAG TPA: MBL fold metallo-hydrolase [Accumulibacter sp.]|uniref:MBL fold metallo-hydrolase n=1 Tax=Accumulibacter sp. TaxID=2053492 RepID=UPI00287A7FA8|nr:MBL fold metallo-hydrolase [Accumulibacter sp.]MDS4054490.1 MBL fold metallo-hydrolase [Accumulibacter sp.]HMV04920.1 MBL fold metallo-hydrolase [Accumulibacter sp.]HNB68008.1 MBL fold metallo-hydrolase [Accumulibacter sp.]HNC25415.1 MBL fold metallo-hydrolase [Accumulibacter sp.]HNE39306.1 MBL fold metallo-hydrolase [Accumulibacter sp.]
MSPRIRCITPEVYQVGGAGLTHANDAAIYLVAVSGGAALIDAGCGRGSDLLLLNLEAAGVAPDEIDFLLLTHCHYDHTGGAAAFCAAASAGASRCTLTKSPTCRRATTTSAPPLGTATN